MKKRNTCFILLCFSMFTVHLSLAQSWQWVKQSTLIGRGNTQIVSVATDRAGNVYETGFQDDSAIFGTVSLFPPFATRSFNLIKYDATGTTLWAKDFPDSAVTTGGQSIATDSAQNSYITGIFTSGNIKLDTFSLHGQAYSNAFIVGLTPNGRIKWAIGNTSYSRFDHVETWSLYTDRFSNTYVTGYYNDSVKFGGYTIPTSGYTVNFNFFILKIDSTGNVLWVGSSSLPGSNGGCYGYGVTADDSGNAYVLGEFFGTVNIGANQLTDTGAGNIFVAKYSPSGNIEWVQSPGIPSTSQIRGFAIAVDNSYNSYITGIITGKAVLGTDTIRNYGNAIYISRLSSGGQFLWTKVSAPFTTPYDYGGWSVKVDNQKRVFTSGTFEDTLNMAGFFFASDTAQPSYILELDSLGNGICGTYVNNNNANENAIALDPLSGNIYFGGSFTGPECYFGAYRLTNPLDFGAPSFLAKWQPCDISTPTIPIHSQKSFLSVFPNPSGGMFTFQWLAGTQNSVSIEIYNVLGEQVYSKSYQPSANGYQLIATDLPNGVYLYRVLKETGELVGEGKVVIEK